MRKKTIQKNENGIKLYSQLKPKTINQSEYIRTISENDITLCSGPAGSGKTAVAIGLACDYLFNLKVEKIIITRPTVETGGGLGFLPGELEQKMNPYMIPVLDELEKYLGRQEVSQYMRDKKIEVVPLEFMRGRNFHNSFVILDEAQNSSLVQIKMCLTRIGKNSKMVLNGDINQVDIDNSGFAFCMQKLYDCPNVGVAELTRQDIIRNKTIDFVLEYLNK